MLAKGENRQFKSRALKVGWALICVLVYIEEIIATPDTLCKQPDQIFVLEKESCPRLQRGLELKTQVRNIWINLLLGATPAT